MNNRKIKKAIKKRLRGHKWMCIFQYFPDEVVSWFYGRVRKGKKIIICKRQPNIGTLKGLSLYHYRKNSTIKIDLTNGTTTTK